MHLDNKMNFFKYLIILSFLSSCSTDNDESKNSTASDTLIISKDIKSTLDIPSDLQSFPEMDSIQKMQYLVPVIQKEMKLDADYIINYMSARLISKLTPKENFTPVIVSLNGDDYGA